MGQRTCSIEGCGKPSKGRGRYCSMHYERRRLHGSFDEPVREPKPRSQCPTEGCNGTVGARSNHGVCSKCYKRQWHEANWERTYRAQVERRNADRGAYLEKSRAYYIANRAHILKRMRAAYADDPTAGRAQSRKWAKENPIRRREHELRRRARKRETQTEAVRYDVILAEFGMVCHICGGDIASRDELHFDHVIPLAKSGTHTYDNIRPSHASCNMHKHTSLPFAG